MKVGANRKHPPDGFPSQTVLRSFLRTLAKKLKTELTVKETLALLREQARLSKQLKETAAARLEMELGKEK